MDTGRIKRKRTLRKVNKEHKAMRMKLAYQYCISACLFGWLCFTLFSAWKEKDRELLKHKTARVTKSMEPAEHWL